MVREVIGFLTLKGFAGVANIYLLVGLGSFIGVGLVYYFMYHQKVEKPPRKKVELTVVQKYLIKIAAALLALLILIFVL